MQAVGGEVEADIAGHRPGQEGRVQPVAVGALEHETAGLGLGQDVALGHGVTVTLRRTPFPAGAVL